MVELTKFESKLIDDMETVYTEAVRGASILQMFISHYDFDMRKVDDNSLYYICTNWETAGQALYVVADYFRSIEEKLEKILLADSLNSLKLEYSETQEEKNQETHISDEREECIQDIIDVLRKQPRHVLELVKRCLDGIAENTEVCHG